MGEEGMKAVNFGSSQALSKHVPKGETKKYNTPAPGAYNVDSKHKFKTTQTSSFGGTMCKVDRAATGLAAEGIRKKDDPGPAHYSKTSAQQVRARARALETRARSPSSLSASASARARTTDQHLTRAPGARARARAAQALNAKERSPTLKFGSGSRDDAAKAYIYRHDTSGTGDPNRGMAGKGMPGPGQYGYGNIVSVKPKSPSHSFGVRTAVSDVSTTKAIGPGAYEHKSSLGKQSGSTSASSPIFGFGTAGRDEVANVLSPGFSPISRAQTPAPGAYAKGSGVGRQAQSNFSSANAWSFGSDVRLKKEAQTTTVPGPGRYSNSSMLGIQSSSRYQTSGGFKFGTSDRNGLADGLVG